MFSNVPANFVKVDDLKEVRKYSVSEGIEAFDLEGPPPLAGTVCKVDLTRNEFRVFPFYDLINKSLHPDFGCFTEVSVNLGASVRDFIEGKRHECKGLESYPLWPPPYRDDYKRCLVVSNTLQTNFIRSNGFVIVDGKVAAKPLYAPGRDDPNYTTLGVAGNYTCLIVSGDTARVKPVSVWGPQGSLTNPQLPPASYGIASPHLVSGGRPVKLERQDAPFRDANGRLNGDWVDWPPLPADVRPTDRGPTVTSFTAFGVDSTGTQLIMASIFEGEFNVHNATGKGILVSVMADLMCRYDAAEAVLGGGSGDTQQFVQGRNTWPACWSNSKVRKAEKEQCKPQFRNAPVRPKPPQLYRGEVEGIRGLGAIAGILPRS